MIKTLSISTVLKRLSDHNLLISGATHECAQQAIISLFTLGLPMPTIIVSEDKNGVQTVFQNSKIIHTIQEFINNNIKFIKDDLYFENHPNQRQLLDSQMNFLILTADITLDKKNEIIRNYQELSFIHQY
jgi:hypothetical protein